MVNNGLEHLKIIILTSLLVYVIFLTFGNVSTVALNVKDSSNQAVANNFMVFVTIILAITTILLTIFGISFTQWYSKQKIQLLKDNMDEVINSIIDDENLKKHLIDQVFKNPVVKPSIEKELQELSKRQREDMKQEFKTYQSKMRDYANDAIKNARIIEEEKEVGEKLNSLMKGDNNGK